MNVDQRAWLTIGADIAIELSVFILIATFIDLQQLFPYEFEDMFRLTIKIGTAILLLNGAKVLRVKII